jgi:hypothetical protein
MDPITNSDLRRLIAAGPGPYISIYLRAHRALPEKFQDPIRMQSLILRAGEKLDAFPVDANAAGILLQPLRELVSQTGFWQHPAEGVALFRSFTHFSKYRVAFKVPELVVVSGAFHLKPLFPAVESDRRFLLLALSRRQVKVFQGTPAVLSELTIPELPEYEAADESEQILLPYFRRVDELLRLTLIGEGTPVILAAPHSLCTIYKQASSYPNLLEAGIHGDPAELPVEKLHQMGWEIASKYFLELRNKAADEYYQLWHTQRASKDPAAVLAAARQGRVKTLFVAAGVQDWGQSNPSGAEHAPHGEDLLNLAAMETFVGGGAVYAVPTGEVPGRGVAAAVFRY